MSTMNFLQQKRKCCIIEVIFMARGISKIWVLILIVIIGGGFLFWQSYKKTQINNNSKSSSEIVSLTPAEEGNKLDYKKIMSLMFPDKEFNQIEEKKFKDKENQTFYIEDIFEGYFINPTEKNLLFIVKRPTEELDHEEGFYNAYLAVFDLKGENILTETFLITADEGKITLYNCKEGTFLLFTGSVTYQGWIDGAVGLYRVKNKKFEKVWPDEKDNDAWADRIADPKEDKIEVYVRKTGIDSNFNCPTKCLNQSSENVNPGFVFIYSFDLNWNQNTCSF